MDRIENRRRIGVLAAAKNISINRQGPHRIDLMLEHYPAQQISRVAGLRNSEYGVFRSAAVLGKTRTVELNPASRPTEDRVGTGLVIACSGKRTRRKCVRFDLLSHPEKCAGQFVAKPSPHALCPQVNAKSAERLSADSPTPT